MDLRRNSASDLTGLIACSVAPSVDSSPQASIITTTTDASTVNFNLSLADIDPSNASSSRQSTLRRHRLLSPSAVVQLRHQASVADSLCRSEAGTNEVSIVTDDAGSCSGDSAQMIADCLLQVLQQAADGSEIELPGGGRSSSVLAEQDCCVYANCNCTLTAATKRAAALALESATAGNNCTRQQSVGGFASSVPRKELSNDKNVNEHPASSNNKLQSVGKSGGCKCCCIS